MKKRFLAIGLAAVMAASVFAGCGGSGSSSSASSSAAAESTAAESTAAESTAAESTAAESMAAGSSSAESTAEDSSTGESIYDYLPTTSLTGIDMPVIESRADVDKAWPKTPADPDNIVIGWSEQNAENDWFIGAADAAQAMCDKYGFTLNLMICDNDVAKQSQDIDTFITQGVDIIVVDPITNVGPVEDIKRAVEAGIPCIAIGTVPDDCPILTCIAPSSFMQGWKTGLYIGEQFDASESLDAATILGNVGASSSEGRSCGMLAGILYVRREAQGNPYDSEEDAWLDGYKMFEEAKSNGSSSNADADFNILGLNTNGLWTVEGGLAAAEDLITAFGDDLDLLLPDNDFMAMGCVTAVENAGKEDQIKIATPSDGVAEALDMVKEGKLLCDGTFSGAQCAVYAVEFINDIFNNGLDPNNLRLGSYFDTDVITADNVDEFYNDDPTSFDAKFYKTPEYVAPKSIDEINAENAE